MPTAIVTRDSSPGGHRVPIHKPEVFIDDPADHVGEQLYTILTPRTEFSGIVEHREFRNGRTTTFDVNLARRFQSDYGYAVEPDLPVLVVRKSRTRGRAARLAGKGKSSRE